EHGDEGDADGEHSEADLFGALEGGLERIHSGFEVAGDVFHDHDGVVDDETGGDGERHQREIVEAVTAEVSDGKGADKRDGDCDGGNERGAAISQENKNDDDDEDDGEGQSALDVADGGSDGGGAVENDGGVNALGNGGLDGRRFGADAIDRVN